MPNGPLGWIRLTARHRFGNAAPLLDRLVVGAVPTLGHGRQPTLFADSLEAKPAISEFGRDRRPGNPGRFFSGAPLVTAATLGGVASLLVFYTPLHKATLGG